MAAFVAAILAQAGDRTPWLAAVLADRYRAPWSVVAGTTLALAGTYAIGAVCGALLGPRMTPEARQLLLGLALVLAGGSALFAPKLKDRLADWRIGAFATSALGLFVLTLGDRTQFIAAALATRTPTPAFAAIGATLGSLVAVVPALMMGEAAYRRLPLAAIRLGSGAILLVAGVVVGLGAVRLI